MNKTAYFKGRRPFAFAFTLLAAAMLFTACGGSGASTQTESYDSDFSAGPNSYAISNDAIAPEMAGDSAKAETVTAQAVATPESSRKIVYNADITMEAIDYDAARRAIDAATAAAGGYAESSNQNGKAEDQTRSCSYTLRIPANNYHSFLAAAGEAGNITRQSESAQDITGSYIDVQARITSLEGQRDRLNELAAGAETTSDLLEIESQLSDVQYELESYTQQMRSMEDQISYSTVELYLSEVASLSPTGTAFLDRLGAAFTGGWQAFVAAMQGLLLALVYLLPLLVLIAIVTIVVLLLVRRSHNKKAAKAASMPAKVADKATADATEKPAAAPSYKK